MRKLKLFFACLLMAVLSIGQVWADPAAAGTTLFSENFSGYSANNVPSGSVTTATGRVVYGDANVTYTCTDGGSTTKIYTQNLAGGTSPEILVSKGNGTFVIAGIPSGGAQEITVSYKQNAQELSAIIEGEGYSTTFTKLKPSNPQTTSFDVTVANGADATFTLTLKGSGSSNVRVDDILVTVKTAGEGGGDTPPTPAKTLESVAVSGNPTKTSYTAGESFDPAGLTVTGTYSDESTAPITSGITWAYNPSQTLAENQTSIGVTATVSDITSAEYPVSISVAAAPAPSTELELTFNVSSNPGGWPTTNPSTLTNYTYTLNNVAYTFGLKSVKCNSGYLMLTQVAVLGLPAIEGYKLVKVDATNSSGCSKTTNVAVTSDQSGTVVNGGEGQVWGTQSHTYTYNLTGTDANTVYYLYVTAKNCQITQLVLKYEVATDAPKQNAGLAYADNLKNHLVKVAAEFTAPTLTNPNNLTGITYASSNSDVVEVNASTGAITAVKAAGKAVITASFAGDDTYKDGSASYTIYVAAQAGTVEDPLIEASAKALIDLGCTMNVYVKGTVASKSYYQTSKTYTVNLTDGFQYYYFYEAAGETVFETDYLKNGDIITAFGTLKKSGDNYRLNPSYMVDRIEYTEPLVDISNTKETAYTVADALALAVNPSSDLTKAVYIKGVVYDVKNFADGKLDIYIKDNGVDNKFEFYRCAGMYNETLTPFADEDAVKIGNEVIGYGVMKYYSGGSIWEFDNNATGDYLVDLQKPVTGVYISELQAQVEVDAQYTLTAHVWPINATNQDIDWTVKSGDAYASVDENGVVTGIAEGEAVIRATAHGTEFYKECTVTVTVPAPDTRSVANGSDFEAISGDLTPADIKFAAFKGDGTTEPKIDAKNIRIYKPASGKTTGGYLKLTALMGYKIDQVEITFDGNATASYAVDDAVFSAVAYITNAETLLTPTGLDAQSVSIVNLKNGSIDVKAIKVWYTGEALPIHHYFLGGTYETEFMQYGTFNYNGLQVFAAYDELETIKEEIFDFTVQANLMTYGNKKAEVYRNSVKIAEYDITVTESPKQNPALAYEPKYDEITLGDAWTAPAFSNPLSVDGITFSSNKTSVAKVTNEGVITLEGGCGTAVITAHFAETTEYVESTATYTIIVNEPAEDLSGTWVVATSVEVGDRIIIADVAVAGEVKTMGLQKSSNRAAVASTVSDLGVLTPAEGTKTFLVVATETEGEYALKALNGYYLYAASKSSNQLKEEASIDADGNANWTIEFENGIATIKAQGKNTNNWIRYNGQNDVFSCYGATNNQADVVIYKHGAAPEPPTPVYETVRGSLTAGNYYTLCFNKTMTAIQGASLWSFAGKDAGKAFIVEAEAPYVAGTPYLIYAESDKLEALTEEVANPVASSNNGLYGTFSYMSSADLDGVGATHMLKNNEIRPLGTNNHLDAQRAYIKISEITDGTPSSAPGRRVRAIPMQENTATDLEGLEATDAPVKVLIDGQIYILRGEKMFDTTGRLVK